MQQNDLLSRLLFSQNIYEELTLLDSQGQEVLRLSRLDVVFASSLDSRAGADEYEKPKAKGDIYYSSVQFNEKTGDPFMTIALPIFDIHSGQFSGVLAANFRFKTVWDFMTTVEASGGQVVYVVSEIDNRVVAHRNPSVVLQGTRFHPPHQDGLPLGLAGTDVILAIDHIKLGDQKFGVVAEKPWSEALALAITNVYVIMAAIIIALVIAGGLSLLVARQIVRPIGALATSARAISAGDLSQEVTVTQLVSNVLEQHSPPETVTVTTKLDPDSPLIWVDSQHIGQVLTNLVTNAYHA